VTAFSVTLVLWSCVTLGFSKSVDLRVAVPYKLSFPHQTDIT
jgi:hypothetical protein